MEQLEFDLGDQNGPWALSITANLSTVPLPEEIPSSYSSYQEAADALESLMTALQSSGFGITVDRRRLGRWVGLQQLPPKPPVTWVGEIVQATSENQS